MTGHNSTNGDGMSTRVERFGDWGGTIGENCSYGEGDALQMVMQLFIDDGVSSRGHRKNIMNPAFKTCGAAVGPHAGYKQMSVQDFAGTFTGKGQAPKVESNNYQPQQNKMKANMNFDNDDDDDDGGFGGQDPFAQMRGGGGMGGFGQDPFAQMRGGMGGMGGPP